MLISSGRIKATITASDRVQLLKTGIIMGEVHAPIFAMEEGAKFQGVSDMGVTTWPEDVPRLPGAVRDMNGNRNRPVAVIGKKPDL